MSELKNKLNEKIKIIKKKKHASMQEELKFYGHKKYMVGSIRNPYEMYVSLYAYGCSKKGKLYNTLVPFLFKKLLIDIYNFRTIKALKRFKLILIRLIFVPSIYKFKRIYSDVNCTENFAKFFKKINKIKYRKLILKTNKPIDFFDNGDLIGILTARFLLMYCKFDVDDKLRVIRKSIKIIPNFWIKNENISSDINSLLNCIEPNSNYKINSKKLNTSIHLPFQSYFDNNLDIYVREYESFIFDLFYKNL